MTDKLIDRREPGFYIVDNEIIEVYGARLGVYGIAVYNVLLKFSNASGENAFPSYQTIADLLGMSRPKAVEGVKLLLECGLIEKTPRMSSSGDPTTNIYTLLDVKKVVGGGKQHLPPSKQHLPGGGKQDLLGGKPRLPDQDPVNNTPIDQDPIKRDSESPPEKPEAAKPPKPSAHPANQAYREVFLRYPNQAQMKAIVDAAPDIGNWVRAIREWNLIGFSPVNIKGMLEWAANPSLIGKFSGNNQKKDTMRNKGGGDGQATNPYEFSDEQVARVHQLKSEGRYDEADAIVKEHNAKFFSVPAVQGDGLDGGSGAGDNAQGSSTKQADPVPVQSRRGQDQSFGPPSEDGRLDRR